MPPEPLGLLLITGSHERAHYAFMLAAAAAAIGRPVVLFATNHGCHALARDWSGLHGAADDARVQAAGVAGLDTLRDASIDLSVRMLACDSGLLMAAIASDALLPDVEVTGIPAFLSAVGSGQVITL